MNKQEFDKEHLEYMLNECRYVKIIDERDRELQRWLYVDNHYMRNLRNDREWIEELREKRDYQHLEFKLEELEEDKQHLREILDVFEDQDIRQHLEHELNDQRDDADRQRLKILERYRQQLFWYRDVIVERVRNKKIAEEYFDRLEKRQKEM